MSDANFAGRNVLYLLSRLQRLTRAVFTERIAHLGISSPMHRVLFEVNLEPGELTSSELARRTYVSPQTVNLVVQRLEERGLLEREPTGHNRGLALSLTGQGKNVLDEIARIHRAVIAETFSGTSVSESDFHDMLEELILNVPAGSVKGQEDLS